MLRLRRRIGPLLARADRARRRGDWRSAARAFEGVLALRPDDAAIWVQLGHASREYGDAERAAAAYARALMIEPRNADTHVMLGHLRKAAGDRAGAIASYADAVAIDPDRDVARLELIAMGARSALPRVAFDLDRRARSEAGVVAAMLELATALSRRDAVSTLPITAYGEFRRAFPVQPPPPGPTLDTPIRVRVDARGIAPAYLRTTLVSLLDQSFALWRAEVIGGAAFADHPIATLAINDARIRFSVDPVPDEAWTLSLAAGVLLDPRALAWLAFAAARTDADAIVCDHDLALDDPHVGNYHGSPALAGMIDPDLLLATARPPIAALWRRPPGEGDIRERLLDVASDGRIAHVPRILASAAVICDRAAAAPEEPDAPVAPRAAIAAAAVAGARSGAIEMAEHRGRLVAVSRAAARGGRVLAIMPTRSQPALLGGAVASLLDRAADPDAIRVMVVDNRGVGVENEAALAALAKRPNVEVRRHDEPFNWSRINNVAATGASEETLLFVNDDTEMLTPGWDRLLLGSLERDGVGAVGARLLYPDGTLQHGGVLFGIDGSPRHEGVGAAANDGGPDDRWRSARAVAAVTGAFMAVGRALFERIGGFDERRFAVGYNDIDLCLRLRETGARILYQPAIEVVHHESKTRGLNFDRERVAWDQGELRALRGHWGDALDRDPGYNPHWSRGPVPFDGLREPPLSEIVAWIDASAARNPWQVTSVEPAR